MKRKHYFLIFLALVQCAWAQKKEWSSPFVGYSTTKVLTLDKVEFEKGKTLLHVTATAASGASISVSPNAYLSAGGKHYAIQKATVLGLGKQYAMPDSGKVHFTMQFGAVPADTRLMHFSEGEVETGWTLCNIRDRQEDLVTDVPEEWRNVTYPDREELPDSYFSDDSTFIRVKILNYVPEAGRKMETDFGPVDFDVSYFYKEYDIALDGTATIGLHPCFPSTIYMRLGKGQYFPLLIIPGKDVSVLMDLGKGGTNAAVAFKGELAKTNYELNVQGAKDYFIMNNRRDFFESLIAKNHDVSHEFLWDLKNGLSKIGDTRYSPSTKEWMTMDAECQYARCLLDYNRFIERKVEDALKESRCSILESKYLWNRVRDGVKIPYDQAWPYSFSYSKKMTFCPFYTQAWTFIRPEFKDVDGNVNTYNKDIRTLYWALIYNTSESHEVSEKEAAKITAPDLKAYYPIAAKRWNDYVVQLNSIPHIHFDQHGDVKKDELKNKVLDDYKGKSVVFLVYDRKKHGKDLDELERDFITKADAQKVVFIHIDTRSASMGGTEPWVEAARQRLGEHYCGKRNRYDSMFSGHSPFFDGQFYYELYATDGTCTLQTTDKKKAFAAIGKWVK